MLTTWDSKTPALRRLLEPQKGAQARVRAFEDPLVLGSLAPSGSLPSLPGPDAAFGSRLPPSSPARGLTEAHPTSRRIPVLSCSLAPARSEQCVTKCADFKQIRAHLNSSVFSNCSRALTAASHAFRVCGVGFRATSPTLPIACTRSEQATVPVTRSDQAKFCLGLGGVELVLNLPKIASDLPLPS